MKKLTTAICIAFSFATVTTHAQTQPKNVSAQFVYYSDKYQSMPYASDFHEDYWYLYKTASHRVTVYVDLVYQNGKKKPKVISGQVKVQYEAPILRENRFETANVGKVYQLTGYSPADYKFFNVKDTDLQIQINEDQITLKVPNFGGYENEFEKISIDTEAKSAQLVTSLWDSCRNILKGKKPRRTIDLFSSSVSTR